MSETIITSSGTITFDGPLLAPAPPSSQFFGVPAATLQQWLLQSQTALQNLLSGAQPSMVLYNAGEGSRQVTYTRANVAQLRARIDDLIAALSGCQRDARRAIAVRF